jgi:hypothetical protein
MGHTESARSNMFINVQYAIIISNSVVGVTGRAAGEQPGTGSDDYPLRSIIPVSDPESFVAIELAGSPSSVLLLPVVCSALDSN